MYKSALPRVLEAYGIKPSRIYDCQKGYRNEIWPILASDGRMLNVTFFKREAGMVDRIRRADAVSEYLASFGMPTRTRFDQRILTLRSRLDLRKTSPDPITTNISVYNYLPGSTIPWEAYTMAHIKLLGATMSDMHAYLLTMSHSNYPSVYDEYSQIIDRMKSYFSKPAIREAIERKLHLQINIERLDDYDKLLQKQRALPGQQVLHMDFVRGNILFDNYSISGILDFEKTSIGHTVVDIARTLAFLLVDCKHKTTDKVSKYFLYSGYQKRGKNKDIGDNLLDLRKIPASPDTPSPSRTCFSSFDEPIGSPLSEKTASESVLNVPGRCEVLRKSSLVRDQLVEMFLLYDLYKFLLHNPYESLCLNEHYERTKDLLQNNSLLQNRPFRPKSTSHSST